MEQIKNPVLPGFNADPSIIRVDDTYYIANSTFEWFPGVRLHESKDMVHWKLLPSALSTTTLLDMKGNPSSGGIWAPDLSYADGKFWLVYTDVKVTEGPFKDMVNYITTAEDIHGPWSDPIRVNGVGFDASLFHDDDGRKYLVQQTWDHREYHHAFDGITLTEFDTDTMQLKPETARNIYNGTEVKLVEGPHLYKINGYYYLFAAQGGTVYTHQEVVARSKTLDELSFETERMAHLSQTLIRHIWKSRNRDMAHLLIHQAVSGIMQVFADVHGLMKISAALTHVVTVLLDVRQRFRKYTGMKKAGLVLKAATAERFL